MRADQIDVNACLQEIKDGREEMLVRLLDHYRPRLARLVSLYVDSRLAARAESADVLQEVFLDATQQIAGYLRRPEVDFYVWLRTLTMQRLAKFHRFHLRAQCRAVSRERSLPERSSVMLAQRLFAQVPTPSEHLKKEESRQRLQRALDSLSETDREVILMRHFEEVSNREVAQTLRIKESAATMRYGRALIRLREAIVSHSAAEESSP